MPTEELHLLALAVVILSQKEDAEIQVIVDEIFDDAFIEAEHLQKEILKTAFGDRAYAIEQARALLS